MSLRLAPVTLADAVALPTMHIIEAQPFGHDTEMLIKLFQLADRIRQQDQTWAGRRALKEVLSGARLFNVFGQPSTRTRFSFDAAAQLLGMDVISSENAGEFSSEVKGESIEDTTRVLDAYGADVIVIRHHAAGTAERAARVSSVPIINAGDGGNQHPTQAILDTYTIWREFGHLDNLTLVMVGDLRYGRTARSVVYLMARFKNIKMIFVSPAGLEMGSGDPPNEGILTYLEEHKVNYEFRSRLDDTTLAEVDVLYDVRTQLEQLGRELAKQPPYSLMTDPASSEEYRAELRRLYVEAASQLSIGLKQLKKLKPTARILHPLPRVAAGTRDAKTGIDLIPELNPDIDNDKRAVYFPQAGNGLYSRSALLISLLGMSLRAS